MLVADVPHPEEQGGHQGDDHHDHGAFQVDGISDMTASIGYAVRGESEGLERLEGAVQPWEPTDFTEAGLELFEVTAQAAEPFLHRLLVPLFGRRRSRGRPFRSRICWDVGFVHGQGQ